MSYQKPPSPPAITAGGESSARVPAWDFVRRHRHWTLPPVLLPLFAAAGFILAAFRQHTGVIVAAVVAGVSVWFFAPHKWTDEKGRPRSKEVWYARLSVLAAGGWLSVASFTGVSLIMLAVLGGLVLAWGIPWFIHKRPRSRTGDKAAIEAWNLWWQHHARQWSLHGSSVIAVESRGTMETLTLQLWAGRQTWRQVDEAKGLIESALSGYVRHGMIRVDRNANPSQALIRLKREDPLAIPSAWHVGLAITSITEPAVIGFTEAGDLIKVSLLGNWFIIGKSRSGKSNELSEILASITGCDDARVWLIDMKGGRAARPWMPAVDWCAVTPEEADVMLGAARDEIKARATHADDSEEQLRPTPQVPAIFIVIDETYEVTSVPAGSAWRAATLAVIASQGMGLAFYVIDLTQYGALDESVRTEQTRANLINRICFAVARAEHGAFALSDYQYLDASRLSEEGSFYMQLGPEAPSAPGRGHKMDHDLVRPLAERHGAMPRMPLTLYASQHQETYDGRWSRLPAPFWRSAPQCEGLAPSPAVAVDRTPDGSIDATSQAWAARIEDEIAAVPDTTPARMPSDEELRAVLAKGPAAFARALAAAPAEGVAPEQIIKACGMSRGWVMGKLKALSEGGVVIKVAKGMYRAEDANEVLAAIGESRRRDDALLAAGR
jgi:hypothetical protein